MIKRNKITKEFKLINYLETYKMQPTKTILEIINEKNPFLKKDFISLNVLNSFNYLYNIITIYNFLIDQYIFDMYFYLKFLFKHFSYFKPLYKNKNFNYIFIKETTTQSYTNLLNFKKITKVSYSNGLILCILGFKKFKKFKQFKKQSKGFIRYFNFVRQYVIPKFLKNKDNCNQLSQVGLVIKGRGKFTNNYLSLVDFLKELKIDILFFL